MSENGTILIERLDLYAYHGCFSEEARLGQRFSLDLVLTTDLTAASLSDALEDSVDYGEVIRVVTETFTQRRFKLLETAARAVAEAILAGFAPVVAVAVTLRKPAAPIPATFAAVGVRLDVRREN